jgi:23S rRNA (pseudouridine1915-N3)-methyltransferase
MHWKFVVVGKPALSYAEAGVAEYLPRLRRYTRAEVDYLKDGPPAEVQKRAERAVEDAYRIVLDERGKDMKTSEWRALVDKLEMQGTKRVCLCIGGANGHTADFRSQADLTICLGKATMQHELALVVALEQIYRVYTLKSGEPYHRD